MKILLTMSAYGAAIILIAFLLRIFFIEKLPKKVFKILWLTAAARMLVPFFLSVQIEIPLKDNNEYISEYNLLYNVTELYQNVPETELAVPEIKSEKKGFNAFPTVQIGGTAMLILFFLAAYIRGIRKYKKSKIIEHPELSEIISTFGLRRKITVLESKNAETFLTYGIINPKIICPNNFENYDKDKIKFALIHEMVHIKNFDALYKIVIAAAVCIHWFNPLSWVMLALANRDLELSCDEELLKRFPTGKKDYALALIDFEEKRRGISLFNSFAENAVEERIKMIMKFKKSAAASTAAAIGIVLCTASVFALSPKIKMQEAAEIPAPNTNVSSADEKEKFFSDEQNAARIEVNEGANTSASEAAGYENVIVVYENDTEEYAEETPVKEYNSTESRIFYTDDGIKISLPPKASYGVIRHVDEENWLSGIPAAEELKNCFGDADDFTYPTDVKYNDFYEYHGAFSVLAPKGENIYAMSDGTVISADFSFPFGRSLVIQHSNGSVWLYAHCDDLCTDTGDTVKAGDIIGHVGSTGATPDNMLYIYNY